MRRALILLPLAAVVLAGCAPRWTKPGATDADFRIARMRCESVGYERVPPQLQWMQLSAGYVTPGHRRCWRSHGRKRCDYAPGYYVPPRFGHVDLGAPARDRVVGACLIDDGWRPVD